MASKEEIRSSHRSRRAALTQASLETAGASIARHGLRWASSLAGPRDGTFALYLGVGSEPPTMPLLRTLHEAGHRVLLPVCEPGLELSWVYWAPESEFVRGRYAPVQEPAGTRHGVAVMRGVDGIVLPATALDLTGNRIGQGGGYYDRFLASLAGVLSEAGTRHTTGPLPTAAVVYDDEVLPAGSIPAEPFDRSVAAALTPGGLLRLGKARGTG